MQSTFVNLCYTMENHAIATMMTSFGSTDHGLGTEVDRGRGGTSSKNRLESPLVLLYEYGPYFMIDQLLSSHFTSVRSFFHFLSSSVVSSGHLYYSNVSFTLQFLFFFIDEEWLCDYYSILSFTDNISPLTFLVQTSG